MIYVGTDIVSIKKIDKIINEKGQKFLNHVFTKKEQKYCNNKIDSQLHYGGKFAAKEAVKKSILTSKIISNLSFINIEVINDNDGSPFIQLNDIKINYVQCQISISHVNEFATAVAIFIINESSSI